LIIKKNLRKKFSYWNLLSRDIQKPRFIRKKIAPNLIIKKSLRKKFSYWNLLSRDIQKPRFIRKKIAPNLIIKKSLRKKLILEFVKSRYSKAKIY